LINVKDKEFGATGLATTLPDVETAAIKKALERAKEVGEALYIPGGTYNLNETLNCTPIYPRSMTIIGEGKGLSRLNWRSGGDGISFSGYGVAAEDVAVFEIRGLSLLNDYNSDAGGGCALALSWPGGKHIRNNPFKRARIHDIEIAGRDLNNAGKRGWQVGISVTNAAGIDISHVDVLGHNGISSDGIVFNWAPAPDAPNVLDGSIRRFLSNIYVNWCRRGISFLGNSESTYVLGFELVHCGIGLQTRRRDDPPEDPDWNSGVTTLANGHIHAHKNGIIIELSHSDRCIVSVCSFNNLTGTFFNGIHVGNGTGCIVTGNDFHGLTGADILVEPGVVHFRAHGNRTGLGDFKQEWPFKIL
jgi:hypothetical protein